MATSEGNYYVPEQSKLPLLASIGMFLTVFGASAWLSGVTTSPLIVAVALFVFAAALFDWSRRLTIVAGIIMFVVVSAASETLSNLLTGPMVFALGGLAFAGVIWNWFSIVIRENIAGLNSPQLKRSYVWGMGWFIFSEVMFFAAFFGALFYVRTLALPWLAGEGHGAENVLLWPGFEANWPLMVTPDMAVHGDAANVTGPDQSMSFRDAASLWTWLPFWNTVILLASSVTCHFAHSAIKKNARKPFNVWLGVTIVLALIFMTLQAWEYVIAYRDMGLTLDTGIYGATFFMLTGFHGAHVLLGTFMLAVMWFRSVLKGHFSSEDSFGFDAASWYWHFVDVVWVGLFFAVYIFG
ncbi:cytochrome c oxidase subunit 3 [Marinimicrobium sp. ABcell2]|uniref:cytochrome c oxidase subunit 3 n=1 Tax=Marinimicrobium sp. ABcell2 TaxID=3069751 RepID=UPI0027B40619|nr:cytochrome c oxidase subunit 3 [Marinimicrobium sp. ABcell2]MDQ2076240.1 cytochrome c oxidase subunit 3 [Marinimicrobium sp. ABcell2]